MKSMFFIFCTMFSIPLSGQVNTLKDEVPPKSETIDVFAVPSEHLVNNGYLIWNFQDGSDGFANSTGEECRSHNGFLLWNQEQGNYLFSPEQLCIPAEKVHTVELRLACTPNSREGGNALLPGASPSFPNEERPPIPLILSWKQDGGAFLPPVTIPLIPDGQYHDYQIELGQNINWTGTISQLAFQTEMNGNMAIDFIRLTGLYFVPFPRITHDYETDLALLSELKELLSESDQSITIGFSFFVEYLSQTDDNGDYLWVSYHNEAATGNLNPHYIVRLAKATNMPVMIWLRGDPWGHIAGAYKQLYADNANLMWTAEISDSPAYHNSTSGYTYLCLAQEDLDGKTPVYWQQTDKLLGQCAEVIGKLIRDNPDYILGVTTTSEYKFNTEDQQDDLDYNPQTIRAFSNYCKQKYGSISALNSACGTDFETFDLQSSDFNPMTIEVENGFDAPRTRGVSTAFWDEWRTFRAQQIHQAVRRQVECISQHIDSKYIYTHQIASEIEVCESPAYCGNVPGANVGIDMFTHEATEPAIREIASFVKHDAHRSWGVPEWLVLRNGDPTLTVEAMKRMRTYSIKYLCPFPWGFGDEFDIKDTPAFEAIRNYLRE